MRPDPTWISDWRIGLAPSRETEVSRELVRVFAAFWDGEGLSEKAKTTRSRYSGALHALGGYLVEQAVSEEGRGKTADELLDELAGPDEGPLIHHDNETWQRDVDTVCRKLHRYRSRQR